MNLEQCQQAVGALPFGKRLPMAVYVYRGEGVSPGEDLDRLVAQVGIAFQIGAEFNVVKFRTDELKVSLLWYPDFFEAPHPALRHAITIDLVRGKARHIDYNGNLNPPILHRKEAFLPAEHPKRPLFVALTEAEEAEGLYEHTATIGFKLNWERLLAAKGLGYKGHRLVKRKRGKAESRRQKAEIEWPQGIAKREKRSATAGENSGGATPHPAVSPTEAERVSGNKTENRAGGEVLPIGRTEGAPQAGRAAPRSQAGTPVPPEGVVVERHKTAMVRYELSKPVRTLLEYGQLRTEATFFDYGCGQGSDVTGLRNLGYAAEGWDPVHRPEVARREADVVNLGYVVNVIEDPAERLETLVDAFRHARRLLVVSALIKETVDTDTARQYADGVLTRANTFQKFFEQQEQQQYIEDALETTAVPVGLGIFYVFRDPMAQQDFIEARTRRTIDWSQISARLGLGAPARDRWEELYGENQELLDAFGKLALELGRMPEPTEFSRLAEVGERLGSARRALRAYVQGGGVEGVDWEAVRVRFGIGQPPKRQWELLYEANRELLEAFWSQMLQLGRMPEAEEFPRTGELVERVGGPNRALRVFLQKGGGEELRRAEETRRNDLLVYLAQANLRKRVPFGHLSAGLRRDIRSLFGNYTRALEKGIELLYAAGDPGEIELACEDLKLGWQDEQALYVHWSLLERLPAVLRAYVGAATTLFGDVHQADVIKLHKASGKVTFLAYDDFEGKALPELRARIKVNLRTRWVQVFDHSAEGQLLYFKERLLAPDHPRWGEMEAFSAKLRKLGIEEGAILGPAKAELAELLAARGLNEKLNSRRQPGRAATQLREKASSASRHRMEASSLSVAAAAVVPLHRGKKRLE